MRKRPGSYLNEGKMLRLRDCFLSCQPHQLQNVYKLHCVVTSLVDVRACKKTSSSRLCNLGCTSSSREPLRLASLRLMSIPSSVQFSRLLGDGNFSAGMVTYLFGLPGGMLTSGGHILNKILPRTPHPLTSSQTPYFKLSLSPPYPPPSSGGANPSFHIPILHPLSPPHPFHLQISTSPCTLHTPSSPSPFEIILYLLYF